MNDTERKGWGIAAVVLGGGGIIQAVKNGVEPGAFAEMAGQILAHVFFLVIFIVGLVLLIKKPKVSEKSDSGGINPADRVRKLTESDERE